MRVIIAGSRDITDYETIKRAVSESGFKITEVVSGRARGVDRLGERWARANDIPIAYFSADWDNFDLPIVVVRTNKCGDEYNAAAGAVRNEQMAKYAEALIAIWDGKSSGTKNMIDLARKYGLKIHIHLI